MRRNILIEIDQKGVNRYIEYDVRDMDSIPLLEYYNGILIPSMTNAHCHLELSHLRGKIEENQPDGLIDFFRSVSRLRNDDILQNKIDSAKVQDSLMWNEGVSLVGDISNDIYTLDIKAKSNIKYRTFAEYYGFGCKGNAESYIDKKLGHILNYAEKIGEDISPTPHSTYLVSDTPFRFAGKQNIVSLHFLESRTEQGFFNGEGRMYEYINSSFHDELSILHYSSSVDRLIKNLPSTMKLLLVHCSHISRSDIEQLVDYFSDVSFVLCPNSNKYIEDTFPNVQLFEEMKVNTSIGTDGLSSNHMLCMGSEIRQIASLGVKLEVALRWSTYGGAKALGYSDEFGIFEVGKRSGVALVSGVDFTTMQPTNNIKIKRIV